MVTDWGLLDSSFYIAPESGTFNNIQYEQGFWIDTGIEFFGIEVDADIKVFFIILFFLFFFVFIFISIRIF